MCMTTSFSIRNFLRQKEALLVHFNTPMSVNHPTGFPGDLHNAKALAGYRLSFSTIQAGDRGPWQDGNPADANAGGSVGIVVDIKEEGSVITVDAGDSGSGASGSLGKPPTSQTCADSIDNRRTSNEWWVQDYMPLGVFMFLPAYVFVKGPSGQGECPIDQAGILKAFSADRIFSTDGCRFTEYDRSAGTWLPISYGDIVPR